MMYDLVVIGTGSAAGSVAFWCRNTGWSVAVVDERPFGGTCALRGCHPKKMIRSAVDALDFSRRMEGRGLRTDGARIDWADLMRFKRTDIEGTPEYFEKSFKDAGIDTYKGAARFAGLNAIAVNGETLEGRRILVASGAKPAKLPIPGAEHLLSSDDFVELEVLPLRIVFVGGGYVSFEFAHIAARAGAKVTVLHRDDKPLSVFDAELVGQLLARSRDIGINIVLDAEVATIEKRGNAIIVTATTKDGERRFEGDLAVHGAGRAPAIDELDLRKGGVEREKRGVKVNEFLQSVSNTAVYAAGDAAASGPPLMPVAAYESDVVASNLLEGNRVTVDYTGVASVAFTIPPIASVGFTEESARGKGLKFRVNRADTSEWFSSRHVAEDSSGYAVLIEEGTDRVLGAHLFGSHADEVINIFALAVKTGIPASMLKRVLFAYPTNASDIASMV